MSVQSSPNSRSAYGSTKMTPKRQPPVPAEYLKNNKYSPGKKNSDLMSYATSDLPP